MQAPAIPTTLQNDSEQTRVRALVRFNGLAFYSLAAASFLETAVPLHVDRLVQVFAARPDVGVWLEQVWWPRRAELGRQMRGLVESTWPEFEWGAAYHEFYEQYRSRIERRDRRAGLALEALGLCVASAEAAAFYRALARSADQAELRALAERAARDHADSFDFFSALFERCRQSERVGFATTWQAAIASCRSARDGDVADAFRPLSRGNWKGVPIVPEFHYDEFRERLARHVGRHAALGPVERLLFRPWLVRERAGGSRRKCPSPSWMQDAPQAA